MMQRWNQSHRHEDLKSTKSAHASIGVSNTQRATRASSTSGVRNVCSATKRIELEARPPPPMAKAIGFFVSAGAPTRAATPRRGALHQPQKLHCSLTADQTSPKPPALAHHHHHSKFDALITKASGTTPTTKINSILCTDCDGNGAIQCTQCKGTGVNSQDHFGGRFKAGQICWLCRGKREILCGSCNGAGFLGGFMSTFDE